MSSISLRRPGSTSQQRSTVVTPVVHLPLLPLPRPCSPSASQRFSIDDLDLELSSDTSRYTSLDELHFTTSSSYHRAIDELNDYEDLEDESNIYSEDASRSFAALQARSNKSEEAEEEEEKQQINVASEQQQQHWLTPRTRYAALSQSLARQIIPSYSHKHSTAPHEGGHTNALERSSSPSILTRAEGERWRVTCQQLAATTASLHTHFFESSSAINEHSVANGASKSNAEQANREKLLLKVNEAIRSALAHNPSAMAALSSPSGLSSSLALLNRSQSISVPAGGGHGRHASQSFGPGTLSELNGSLTSSQALTARARKTNQPKRSTITAASSNLLSLPIIDNAAPGPMLLGNGSNTSSTPLSAAGSVKALLEYYRTQPAARAALEQRVTQVRKQTRRGMSATLSINRNRAGNADSLAAEKEKQHAREEERRRLQMQRKAQLLEQQQQQVSELQRQIENRPTSTSGSTAGNSASQGGTIDERQQRKRLQSEWLSWLSAIDAQVKINALCASELMPKLQAEREAQDPALVGLNAEELAARERAMQVLSRALSPLAAQWRERRRREATHCLIKFLDLVHTKEVIKKALRDTSVAAQITIVQRWWRRKLQIIHAQRILCMHKWKRREAVLNRAATPSGQLPSASSSSWRSNSASSSSSSSSSSSRPSSRAPMSRASKLSISSSIVLDPSVSRRIPLAYKASCVAKLVSERRAQHRVQLVKYYVALAAWQLEHAREIEVRNTRNELGLTGDELVPLFVNQPKRPHLRAVPHHDELDRAIEECAKAFLLDGVRLS